MSWSERRRIIDLGPEGGDGDGRIVAAGTPEDVAKVKESYTGRYLKDLLRRRSCGPAVLITAYRPDASRWHEDNRTRK